MTRPLGRLDEKKLPAVVIPRSGWCVSTLKPPLLLGLPDIGSKSMPYCNSCIAPSVKMMWLRFSGGRRRSGEVWFAA